MLKVSETQFEGMIRLDDEAFIDLATDHVMSELAPAVGRLPRDLVREMTANGLARAKGRGLVNPKARLAFIALMWEIGPNFDTQAEIDAALREGPGDADARFNAMLDTVSDAAWSAAERGRDSRYWYPELLDDTP